jgi:hypothetical protein
MRYSCGNEVVKSAGKGGKKRKERIICNKVTLVKSQVSVKVVLYVLIVSIRSYLVTFEADSRLYLCI